MRMAEMWGVGQRWGVLEIRGTQLAVPCWGTFGSTYIYIYIQIHVFIYFHVHTHRLLFLFVAGI